MVMNKSIMYADYGDHRSRNRGLKFRENLPNSQKFRGPTQSRRSQGSQR